MQTYVNPIFFNDEPERRTNYPREERFTPPRSDIYSSKRELTPTKPLPDGPKLIIDAWTIVPLVLLGMIICVVVTTIIKKQSSVIFCGDGITGKCTPCPKNGECLKGQLIECYNGYIRKGNSCIIDKNRISQTEALSNKIAFDIAKNPDSTCKCSIPFTYDQIELKYGDQQYFDDAISTIFETDYQIELDSRGRYISKAPYLTFKCKAKLFISENIVTVILFSLIVAAFVYLTLSVIYKKHAASMIKSYADSTYQQVVQQSGTNSQTIQTESFAPPLRSKLHKFWPQIQREVEKHKDIYAFNNHIGRCWRYVHH